MHRLRISFAATASLVGIAFSGSGAEDSGRPTIPESALEKPVWREGIGSGFVRFTRAAGVKFSRGFGTAHFGSTQSHDLWLAQVELGTMLTGVLRPGQWYAGNFECFGQFMAGGQDRPESAYLTGLNCGLRYHFATGTRLVPFLGGSAGVVATDIHGHDLNGVIQFNEQFGLGVRYFINQRNAISLEYAAIHISNAGLSQPNNGVNTHMVSLGFSHLF